MFLYNIGVLLYACAIYLASPFKKKAKQWVDGRKNWEKHLSEGIKKIGGRKRIWIHCASLGEFEQGLPLIESIKKKHPEHAIILTFFSPSGYEVRKNYELADIVLYLPLDTRSNAKAFLEIVKPDLALFIKYEFWVNFLNVLKEKQVTTYLISAVFKDHHPFFKWYGGVFRRSLSTFKMMFVQDVHSQELLKSINISNVEVTGDTRFDRVLDIKKKFSSISEIEKFKGDSKLIVAGSTWPKDEDLLLKTLGMLTGEQVKLLIVPHNIEDHLLKNTLSKIESFKQTCSLYSEGLKSENSIGILNTMGLLSKVYYYADVAYIGGGLDGGIHNCLEPAVYGTTVAFAGPNFTKYNEAVSLIHIGAAKSVNEPEELAAYWKDLLNDERRRKAIAERINAFFESNSDSTSKIIKAIGL